MLDKFLNPTTLGAVVCVGIALADIWHFHSLGTAGNSLLYVGLGGLLGYSLPNLQAGVQAVRKQNPTPTQPGATS